MAKKVKPLIISKFNGGYNSFANKTQVKDNESPDMKNMDFVGIDAIRRRYGYIKYSSEISSGKRVNGIFSYYNGSSWEVLYISGTKLYRGSNVTEITGGSFTDDTDANACQAGDRLYICNGVDPLSYYDGSNISTTGISNAPSDPKFCIFWSNRLYVNDKANPSRIYFGGAMGSDGSVTNTGNFGTGSPAYGGYLDFGKGKIVTGLSKFGDYLYVFFEDQIIRLQQVADTGESNALDHTTELITNSHGCISHRSIDQVENDLYFLGYNGIYSLGEQPDYVSIRTKELSARVKSLIDAIPTKYIDRAAGIYYKNKYYLAVTEGTYNDTVIIYDTRYGGWLYWKGLNANSWLEVKDSNSDYHLYFASDDTSSSYIYEAEQGGNDDGSAIDWYYYTKNFDLGDFSYRKKFVDGAIQFGPVYGQLTIDVIIDETEIQRILTVGTSSDYADGIGTAPIGYKPIGLLYNTPDGTETGTLTNDWRYFDIDSEGNTIQFKLSGSVKDESAQIEKIKINYWLFPSHYVRDSSKYIN